MALEKVTLKYSFLKQWVSFLSESYAAVEDTKMLLRGHYSERGVVFQSPDRIKRAIPMVGVNITGSQRCLEIVDKWFNRVFMSVRGNYLVVTCHCGRFPNVCCHLR